VHKLSTEFMCVSRFVLISLLSKDGVLHFSLECAKISSSYNVRAFFNELPIKTANVNSRAKLPPETKK
jgi:hypothetical protein